VLVRRFGKVAVPANPLRRSSVTAFLCFQSLANPQKLARTIKAHWDGILAFYPNHVTSAAIEAINGLIQTALRRARGYRNLPTSKPFPTG